jgi:tRNA/tmRNA/rRNA uracil-C5-methylase (TrmA/RlmC/RlmD family)
MGSVAEDIEVGVEVELALDAIASGGGCVGREPGGRVVFVRHAIPGERVPARVTEVNKRFLRADALQVLESSPHRVVPPCEHAGPGRCGGCDWQHIDSATQRRLKAELVQEQLRRVARLERAVEVIEMPNHRSGLGWRTRVRYLVGADGRIGFRKYRSHELHVVDRCLVATSAVAEVPVREPRLNGAEEIEVFALRNDRVAGHLVSVSSSGGLVDELAGIGGVIVDGEVHDPPAALIAVVGDEAFRVSHGAFWQVHEDAPKVLTDHVTELLAAQPGDRILDLYAGVGLFSVPLARQVGALGRLVAIEMSRVAHADLVHNLGDLSHAMAQLGRVTPSFIAGCGGVDLVVLDPPRQGAGAPVMEALARARPRAIVYVSCDVATFARDVKVMTDNGWSLDILRCLDIFPMTEHVEIVARLVPSS